MISADIAAVSTRMTVEGLVVESFLPREFFGDLGLFLQTCAHIEQVASAIVTTLDIGAPPDQKISDIGSFESWMESYFKVRKKMKLRDLNLKIKPSRMPLKVREDQKSVRALEQIGHVLREIADIRDMAAHGAFIAVANQSAFFRTDFIHYNSGQIVRARDPITQEKVHEIIRIADVVLKSLIGILDHLAPGFYIRLSQFVYPVVAHPDRV